MRGMWNGRRALGVAFLLLAFAIATFGQTPEEGWRRIGVGAILPGNITAFAVSPSYNSDQTVYAGVAGNGLWRSTDRGNTWTHLSSVPNWETVTAIAPHGAYGLGSGKAVYVGTFDGWVYTSFDDFATVNPSYKRQLTAGNGTPVWISALAAPAAGTFTDILFVATLGAGIYYNYGFGGAAYYQRSSNEIQTMAYALAVSPEGRVFGTITYSDGGPVFECTGLTAWSPFGPSSLVGRTGYSLSAVHDSSGQLNLFLGTSDHGMWRWKFSAVSEGWVAACDGTVGATTAPSPVNAVAGCSGYGSDQEVWEGRGDGLWTSVNEGSACAPSDIGALVHAISFSPGYHTGGHCDAFVATDSGLFRKSCGSSPPPIPAPAPIAVSASALALSNTGLPGTWGGGSLGLIRATRSGSSGNPHFLQYNASGSAYAGSLLGKTPFIKAICLTPTYAATGACGTDAATLFVAEWSKGVFQSTDHGNSWTQLATGWPSGASPVYVNDLAISPRYATGGGNETLFAATNVGLYRWDGSSTGWGHVATDWNYNFTRVALPPTYDRTAQDPPASMVLVATDNPSAGMGGLYFSLNHGLSLGHFGDAMEAGGTLQYPDITSIGFSPGYGVVDALLFISRASGGVYFTSMWPTSPPVFWCAMNAGIPSLEVRQLAVRPDAAYGNSSPVGLLVATSSGPAYWDVPKPLSSYQCVFPPSGMWTPSTFSAPTGCPDTYAATFAYLSPDGRYAALGTAQDGVFFSTDFGKSFLRQGTGYRSLPDDIFITLPYARDNNYLFATSPTYGLFVSRDKGGSFQPFNGRGCTPLNNGAFGLGNGFQRGQVASPTGWNIDALYAGTACSGIQYRWLLGEYVDVGGPIKYYPHYLDWYDWAGCTLNGGNFTGPVQKIINLTNGNSSEIVQAASRTQSGCGTGGLGMLFNPAGSLGYPAAINWVTNNSGLPSTEATSQKPGQDTALSATPLADGVSVSGSVPYNQWHHYYLAVPSGQAHLSVTLSQDVNDPDLYIRYAQIPDYTHYHYCPYIGPPGNEVVDVYPTSSPQPLVGGIWYISVRGYSSGANGYTLTASLLASYSGKNPLEVVTSPRKAPLAGLLAPAPEPQAPSAGVSWGTVSNSGVWRGIGAPGLAATPLAVSWSPRNGTTPTNLDLGRTTQTVLQCADGTLLAGQNGALWRSPAPDEGQTTWENISSAPTVASSSLDVREFLECSNGDVLAAVNGTSGLGGVWLSGSKGSYWMSLSSGFDALSQKLESLVQDNPITGSVQYYTGTDETGAYTRTITAPPYPTISSLGQTSGSAAGGQTFTITGTGFSNACPTGTPSDCPFLSSPQVFFGDARVPATWLGGTQLSVTTQAHGVGTFAVRVMNPDTRMATALQSYSFTGDANLTLYLTRFGGIVTLNWGTTTQLTVQRSTSPLFTSGLVAFPAVGSAWTDASSATTDSYLYFYRIQ